MIRRRFILWLSLFAIALLVNHVDKWPFFQLIIVFLMMMPIFSIVSLVFLRRRLSCSLSRSKEEIERGMQAEWLLTLHNDNRLGTIYCEAKVKAINSRLQMIPLVLNAKEGVSLNLGERARHCGILTPEGLSIHLTDSFRFFSLRVKPDRMNDEADIYVLPRTALSSVKITDYQADWDNASYISQKSNTIIDEIDRMRPMQAGDRMRSIHWKLSARMQSWMVRQYEKADERYLTVFLDLPDVTGLVGGELDYCLTLRDFVLDRASADIEAFINQGFRLTLKSDLSSEEAPEARTLRDYILIRRRLALFPYSPRQAFSEILHHELMLAKGHVYYVITTGLDAASVSELKLLRHSSAALILLHIEVLASPERETSERLAELRQNDIRVRVLRGAARYLDESSS